MKMTGSIGATSNTQADNSMSRSYTFVGTPQVFPFVMNMRQLMKKLNIKSLDVFFDRMNIDHAFPRPIGAKLKFPRPLRLGPESRHWRWTLEDLMAYRAACRLRRLGG